jgi:hypothetical protein
MPTITTLFISKIATGHITHSHKRLLYISYENNL